MAHPQIAVFASMADGQATATRTIEGQKTLLGRTMHSIEYDAVNDEIIAPHEFGQAVLVFRGGASGQEAPIRIIQGPKTQLQGVDRLAVDPVNDEILVPDADRILVFSRTANGDVAPKRILSGPDTLLGATSLVVDPERDLLIVAGYLRIDGQRRSQILTFDRTAQGNAKPKSIIAGPKTGLTAPKNIRLSPKGWIVLGQDGMQPPAGQEKSDSFVGVWHITDQGNVAPRWTIGGPNGRLVKPRGVALDLENKTVIVSDKFLNAVLTYSVPEIF